MLKRKSIRMKFLISQSPNWSRIDVRQKKITRALSLHTKDFLELYMKQDKQRKKKNWFVMVDELMTNYFPNIYKDNKLNTFGSLGRICLMTRFSRMVET